MSAVRMPSMADNVVAIENVSVTFATSNSEKLSVLQNISFSIKQREFICILGPSGCGKTTLLNILAGFLRPSTGEIRVDGISVSRPRRRSICLFQGGSIFPWLTVSQNIGFGLQHLSKDDRAPIIARYISLVGLSGFEDAYPHQLSGGMCQRVELARALAANPSTIFMDEPFSALDYVTRSKLRRDLSEIWQHENKTIVFVTHDIDEAMHLADRIIVLSHRPAKIQAEIELPLQRPRALDSSSYVDIRNRLHCLLRIEGGN